MRNNMRIFGLILVIAIQISCEDVKEIQHCLEIDYQFDTEIAYEFPSSDKISSDLIFLSDSIPWIFITSLTGTG